MLSVQEAIDQILSRFRPVEQEIVPLEHAAGRVLAEDILAAIDLPAFDNSSVDGFALRPEDGVAGRTLRVVADLRAGATLDRPPAPGEAVRIMTGAALPPGEYAVIMVEDTDFNGRGPETPAPTTVTLHKTVTQGENIRRRGSDLKQGELVIPKGQTLRAQEVGLLAMLGKSRVNVYRRPRLAMLSSGDELLSPEQPLVPGKIHESNSYMLTALATKAGAIVIPLGIARDDQAEIRACLDQAVEAGADVIVSSAGVSVGAFDYVKSVIESEGRLEFWRVNMRPGKPLAFGNYRGIPFFGLPGNPVSAFVGFELFVRPAIERLSGGSPPSRLIRKVRLAEAVESDGRESYLRAIVREENGTLMARLAGHQGSGNIFSLVRANALLIIPSGVKCVPADSEINAWFLD